MSFIFTFTNAEHLLEHYICDLFLGIVHLVATHDTVDSAQSKVTALFQGTLVYGSLQASGHTDAVIRVLCARLVDAHPGVYWRIVDNMTMWTPDLYLFLFFFDAFNDLFCKAFQALGFIKDETVSVHNGSKSEDYTYLDIIRIW